MHNPEQATSSLRLGEWYHGHVKYGVPYYHYLIGKSLFDISKPADVWLWPITIVGGPIVCGVALAAQVQGTGHVAIVSFGDGAMNQEGD